MPKIQNNQGGRALSNALVLEGVKQAPTNLNGDQVQAILDWNQGGFGMAELVGPNTVGANPSGGAQAMGVELVAENGLIVNKTAAGRRWDVRMISLDVGLTFNGGTPPANGNWFTVHLYFQEYLPGGEPGAAKTCSLIYLKPAFLAVTNRLEYKWALGGFSNVPLYGLSHSWNGIVPGNVDLLCSVDYTAPNTLASAVWPANSLITWSAIGYRVPGGVQNPA